jgi:NADPH:quinone reductase
MNMHTGKEEMRTAAIDRFGGPEVLKVRSLPMPAVKPNQILIHVASAGVGVWDVGERTGLLPQRYGIVPEFPMVLGSEGAGEIVAVGANVSGFAVGDLVYSHVWQRNPKGGFYAEYTAVDADQTTRVPATLSVEEAGALMIDGVTALKGLDEVLHLKPQQNLLIFGASGGIGHLAVQLAKRMGARVFAVASGADGVALTMQLGADAAVDGHAEDIVAAARAFTLNGFDAALLTAGGEAAERAITSLRAGGLVAFTYVQPAPKTPPTIQVQPPFFANRDNEHGDPNLIAKLNRLIEAGSFEVHLGKIFSLDQAAEAQQALETHFLGRIALLPGR